MPKARKTPEFIERWLGESLDWTDFHGKKDSVTVKFNADWCGGFVLLAWFWKDEEKGLLTLAEGDLFKVVDEYRNIVDFGDDETAIKYIRKNGK